MDKPPDLSDTPASNTNIVVTKKGAAIGVLSALLLGVAGDGVWDLVAKPGLSRVTSATYELFASISVTVRDTPYEIAALDPTPLPSLILQYVFTLAPAGLIGVILGMLLVLFTRERGHRRWHERREKLLERLAKEGVAENEAERHLGALRREHFRSPPVKRLAVLVIAMLIVAMVGLRVVHSVINQGVLIRRIFAANLQIAAPALTEDEEEIFQARFAAVGSKADFERLSADVQARAAERGIRLRSYTSGSVE